MVCREENVVAEFLQILTFIFWEEEMWKVKRTLLNIFCNDPILGFYLFNCFVYYLIVWCVIFINYLDFRDSMGILKLLGMKSYFMKISSNLGN